MKAAMNTNRLVIAIFGTSKFRAKFNMSLSVILVESCSSLLASAAGDNIASNPKSASAYAVFMPTVRLRQLETRVTTCKLYLDERELINGCEVSRLSRLYALLFS